MMYDFLVKPWLRPRKKRSTWKTKRKQGKFWKACALLLTVVVLGSSTGAAFFAAPVVVYANPATTIAEYILTLLASVNLGVSDPQVINGLTAANQAVNNVAMAEASVSQIGQFIDTAVANGVPQQLFDVFGTTAEQAAQYVLQMPANTLSTTAAQLADPATNLYASAQTWVNTGAIFPAVGGAFILPGLGATVGVAAAAVGAGIGLGFLIDAARRALKQAIKDQLSPIDLSSAADAVVYEGGSIGFARRNNVQNYFSCSENVAMTCYAYRTHNIDYITIIASPIKSGNCFFTKSISGTVTTESSNITNTVTKSWNWKVSDLQYSGWSVSGIPMFNSSAECYAYMDNIIANGLGKSAPSSWLVGNQGNQTTNNGVADQITSQINPQNQTISPISMNDYINWANTANQNTNNGVTGQEQGNIFQTFIDNFITNYQYPENPDTPENPDNPTVPENPTIPEIPQNPVVPENPEDVPDIEDYPELKPTIPAYPQITPTPELTPTPEATPTPPPWDGYTPGLERKFPFCLPWDIYSAFTLFMSDRKAPHIQGNINLGMAGRQAIDLDFSMWDDQAGLLRLLELIGFIIALVLLTKHLLK